MFPDIDTIHEMLDEISDRIPLDIYKELNGGIVLVEEIKYHPEMEESRPLYILGEYVNNYMRRNVNIYYGSLKAVYENEINFDVEKKLEEVLFHELTHHLESLAGEDDLGIEDHINMEKYRAENKKTSFD